MVRLLQEYADLALAPSIPPANSDARMELKARLHKLAGTAGMVGATELTTLALEAEQFVRKNGSTVWLEKLMERLALALITLREQSEPLIRPPAPNEVATVDFNLDWGAGGSAG